MATFELQSYYRNYIDGRFVDGGAGRLVVDNPGTGKPLAEQAIANGKDVDAAVAAAAPSVTHAAANAAASAGGPMLSIGGARHPPKRV